MSQISPSLQAIMSELTQALQIKDKVPTSIQASNPVVSEQAQPSIKHVFACDFCKRPAKNAASQKSHQYQCAQNPNRSFVKYTCSCGAVLDPRARSSHETFTCPDISEEVKRERIAKRKPRTLKSTKSKTKKNTSKTTLKIRPIIQSSSVPNQTPVVKSLTPEEFTQKLQDEFFEYLSLRESSATVHELKKWKEYTKRIAGL